MEAYKWLTLSALWREPLTSHPGVFRSSNESRW